VAETTVATEVAIAAEVTPRELRATASVEALELRAATCSEVRACARTYTRLSAAYRAASSTDLHAAPSAHSTAPCHATACTCLSAAATTPATAVVLSQYRTSDCQTQRQGCRADNSEFRHSASPQKVSSKTSALADGSGSQVI